MSKDGEAPNPQARNSGNPQNPASPEDPQDSRNSAGGVESPAEALGRARVHARNAAFEAIAALRALLDAAALGISAQPAEQHRVFAKLARALDDLSERFSSGNIATSEMSFLILQALDAEIARWEGRSQDDPNARAVLRAFLGMREILWEFGIRERGPAQGAAEGDDAMDPTPARGAATRRGKPARVQRVEVQG